MMTLVWIFLALGALYIGAVIWLAKNDTKNAPKQDMFTCDKHGVIPLKYSLPLTGLTEEPIRVCPMCMEDRFREARSKVGLG